MIGTLAVGTGAGLSSALLFAVVITGSPLAIVLSYLSPLPIFMAAMGWNHRAGLVGACVGVLVSMLAFRMSAGLAYGLGLALPAWWLGYLALLGRAGADGGMEWYPLGRLLAWIAAIAAVVTLLGALALGSSYEDFRAAMRAALNGMLGGASAGDIPEFPGHMTRDDLVDMLVTAIPVVSASAFVPIQVLNLWLAAKVVSVSGRLARPWPYIPQTAMPTPMLGALALAIAVGILGHGFVGLVALALGGALMSAYALQGLASIHALTRGRAARPFLLATLYALLMLFVLWVVPLLAVAGILDAIFQPRRRLAAIPPHFDI